MRFAATPPPATWTRSSAFPLDQPTSMTFGGDDLSTLCITTARENFTEAQIAAQPHAGDIFACTPGTAGRLPDLFTA